MLVTQVCIGRFHHFHLARQLERFDMLKEIWTGYPKFALRHEVGIASNKIKTFPWLQAPFMKRSVLGLDGFERLNREWVWHAQETLDKFVASRLNDATVLVGLSASGLHSGRKAKNLGGYYICDRGSSHIRYQNSILTDEFKRWGLEFPGIDPRIVEKEEAEYREADIITVPSEFVRRSFLEMQVPPEKLRKVTYGARLDRFKKVTDPPSDVFRIIWVGSVSIRKGFMYLLKAFQSLKHPHKELVVIGNVTNEVKKLLINQNLDGLKFLGLVNNAELPLLYSSSHVFVLPSLEEGLAMVQGEALACGCPIIGSVNSGAEELISDGVEGFLIPIRSSDILLSRLQELVDDPVLRSNMSKRALERVNSLGGWDNYGNQFKSVIEDLSR